MIKMSYQDIIKKAEELGMDPTVDAHGDKTLDSGDLDFAYVSNIASQLGMDPGHFNINDIADILNKENASSEVPERLRNIRDGKPRNTPKPEDSLNLRNRKKNAASKNNGFMSRFRKKKNKGQEESEEKANSEEGQEDDDAEEKGQEEVKKTKKKIKRVFSIFSGVFIFILAIILFAVVSAIAAFFGVSVTSAEGYTSGSYTPINKVGTTEYQQEITYHEKIKEKQTEYKNKCGNDLNINFLHSSIIYYYYSIDTLPISSDDKVNIDYGRMSGMVDHVASLMYGESCYIDYSKNGELYNKLKNDATYRNYYSNILKKESMDDILSKIIDLSEMIDISADVVDRNFIPENTVVQVNSATSKTSNGLTSYKNNSDNKEYIMGVIYANLTSEEINNTEKLKAYIIAYTTNILAKNQLTINSETISLADNNDISYCNVLEGCSYTTKNGNRILQVGGGSKEKGNTILYQGKYYYHRPMYTNVLETLIKLVDEIYGYVLVDGENKYNIVDVDIIRKSILTSYKDILKDAYPKLMIKLIREDVYDNGVNYGNKKVVANIIGYEQLDYSDVFFCHRKGVSLSKNSIGSSGCGITAMAIVASSYENNKKYDPIYMNERAYQTGNCGYNNGTYVNFFKTEAAEMKYNYLRIGTSKTSEKNLVTSHLREGHLIVASMGAGKFTSGGHYIVLGGIDPDTKRVYVQDPYNRSNKANPMRNSGNGWYSFNDIIAKQATGFYIMWKG